MLKRSIAAILSFGLIFSFLLVSCQKKIWVPSNTDELIFVDEWIIYGSDIILTLSNDGGYSLSAPDTSESAIEGLWSSGIWMLTRDNNGRISGIRFAQGNKRINEIKEYEVVYEGIKITLIAKDGEVIECLRLNPVETK